MRKTLISAATLLLLAAPSAWADPPGDRGPGDRGHGGGHEEGHGGPPQHQAGPEAGHPGGGDRGRGGPAPQAAMPNRGPEHGNRGQMGNQAPQMAGPPNRADGNRSFDQRGAQNRNAFNDNRRGSDFNRDGRTNYRAPGVGGPRHDFSGFRDFHRDFRASHRFQVSSYRHPAGWYSHRWAFGEFLPAAFWARDYWLIDFADYDLPPPPYGAVWVRVDRDALLIDEDSGEVITVVYDVFY